MKSKLVNILRSTVIMVVVFLVFQIIKLLLVYIGGMIVDIHGEIILENIDIKVVSYDWNLWAVLLIYLMPFVLMLLFLIPLGRKYNYPISSPLVYRYFKVWGLTILLTQLLFGSVVELLSYKGLYYPLTWLGFTYIEKGATVIILMIYFVISVFKLGPMWTATLLLDDPLVKNTRLVNNHVLYNIIVPAILLIIGILFMNDFRLNHFVMTYIVGLLFTILIPCLQIRTYKVIIS